MTDRTFTGSTPHSALHRVLRETAEQVRNTTLRGASPAEAPIDRGGQRRARRRLGGFAGTWALLALLSPSAFGAVLPRLFLPWLDDVTTPFSFARCDVRPPGATVRFGEGLNVSV